LGLFFAAGSRELKVLGLSSEHESLFEVIGTSPVCGTPTAKAKAKAVAGLVLGVRFAHSLGLVDGHLTPTNSVLI
jgi:hypothetical protein